ncbi:hypothetical protein ACJMK2_002942 [Sinanodonta woodiana]|uniref:PHTF1/2 N-terminal domain-containing protein n=1 Tax=Sinanodonta woodiana TaxID=1069815 RepID=A0ABD3XWV9_SINWO
MDRIHDTVAWYQQRIGSYDKQLWEQSVEHKVLKNIRHLPRRSVRLKTELIDVDLVRGSTFTKVTPQVPWSYVTLKTIGRVLFFPLYYKWWIQQTSWKFWLLLLVLYVMQVGTTVFFFIQLDEKITQHEPVFSEVMIPGLLMVLLGLIHSQTVLSHMSLKPPVRDKKDGLSLRRKRSLSQPKTSVTNMDSVNSKVLGKPANTSQSDKNQILQVNLKEKKTGVSSLRDKADSSSSSREGKSRKEKKIWSKSSKSNSPTHHLKESSRHQKEVQAGRRGSQDSESAYISHDASDSHERTSSHEAEIEAEVFSRPVVKDETFEGGLEKGTEKRILSDFRSRSRERESQDSDVPEESPYEKDRSHTDEEKDTASEDEHTFNALSTDDSRGKTKVCTRSESQNSTLTVTSETDDCTINREVHDGLQILCDKETHEKIGVNADVHLVKVEKNNQNYFQRNPKHVEDWRDSASFMVNGIAMTVCEAPENGTAVPVCCVPENNTSTMQCENYKTNLHNSNNVDLKSMVLGGPESQITVEVIGVKSPLSMAHQSTRQSTSSSEESMLVNDRAISNDILSVDKTSEKISIYPRKTILFETSRSDTILQNRTNLSPSKVRSAYVCDTDTDNEESPNYKSVSGLRRRKVTLQEGSDFKTKRDKRPTLLLTAPKDDRASTCISSSDGESNIPLNPDYNQKNTVSSEEWEDRMQTDVSTSSYSSSCCSDADIMDNEPEQSEEGGGEITQPYTTLVQGISGNNVHLVNLLQPPSNTNQSQGHGQPDKVTCIIWELNECKKIELTAMDIGWAIIETVDKIPESSDYIRIGLMFSILMALTPLAFHIYHNKDLHILTCAFYEVFQMVLNNPWRLNLIVINGIIQRLCLSSIFFFLHSVADRTFKQRLLYAKHFCYLTSSRRARKFDMPHFRLNKVRNIKTWLSLRSYLKKRGPQRSVDMIVSSSFLLTIILLILMCLQLLQEPDTYLDCLCNWELLMWCLALGVYLLRFMTLGLKINKKYRNLSVLITEQINLYLQMEQKPHKKEELMVSNNVLKLAESLIKELESPFKISGISANPFFLNVTKVVVLSAFSAVLSEILGFKLKLTKIKLKD